LELEDPLFNRNTRREYIIDLRGDYSDIVTRMHKEVRRRTRKAIKNDLSFHEGHSTDSIACLESLIYETKKARLSKGYKKYSHFYMPFLDEEKIYKLFQSKAGRLFVAKKGDEVLSAEFIVIHSKRAYFLLNGTSQNGYRIGANPFLLSTLIEKLKEEGAECANFGGLPEDSSASSLASYKCSFGAEELICEGGSTQFLCGPLRNLNPIFSVYQKTLKQKVKKILGNQIIRRINFFIESLSQ
jgi:lipid II:glycine glycyltransferase (peptidoglycan interpeptide bridge formation enzyme)